MFQAGVWTADVLAVLHASVLRALCEEERGESLHVQVFTCPSVPIVVSVSYAVDATG